MPYTIDDLHVRLLNEDADYALLDQPDQQSVNLGAVLQGRRNHPEFTFVGLGHVELRGNPHSFGVSLAMKIEGQAAAAGECVWVSCASQRSWNSIRQFFDAITEGKYLSQAFPPASPWLCLAFLPDVYQRLTRVQRAAAIAILWGRAYQVRKQATLKLPLN